MNRAARRDRVPSVVGVEKSTSGSIASQRYPARKNFFSLILVVAVACGVYVNSMTNEFVFDDQYFVIDNPHIKALSDFPSIFTTGS